LLGCPPTLATLGAGTVTLNGGTLLLQGQQSSGINQQQPIGISGFNADTIIDAANAPGYATKTGVAFLGINPSGTVYQSSTGVLTTDVSAPGEVHNQTVFFQNGWSKNGNQTGLPASGYFSSAFTNVNSAHTTFFFGYNGSSIDYADNNTFSFNNASSGALTATLASPGVAANLDFLATSTVATNFDVTLNFNTGSPSLYTSGISTGPLATGGGPANVALANIKGTNNGNSNDIDNGGIGAMHLTESDITLLPGDANREHYQHHFHTNQRCDDSDHFGRCGNLRGKRIRNLCAVSFSCTVLHQQHLGNCRLCDRGVYFLDRLGRESGDRK